MQRRSIALWRRSPQGPTIDGKLELRARAGPIAYATQTVLPHIDARLVSVYVQSFTTRLRGCQTSGLRSNKREPRRLNSPERLQTRPTAVTAAFDQPRTPALPVQIVCHLLGSGNQLHPAGLGQPALTLSHRPSSRALPACLRCAPLTLPPTGTYATCVAASPHAHCVGAAVYPATYAYVPAGTVTPAFDQPRAHALPLQAVCHLLGSGNQLHPTGLHQPALTLSNGTLMPPRPLLTSFLANYNAMHVPGPHSNALCVLYRAYGAVAA